MSAEVKSGLEANGPEPVRSNPVGKVMFYHLVHHRPAELIRKLSERVLASGGRVMVRGADERQLRQMDDMLWSQDPLGFLPHGMEGKDQPVLLGQGEIANKAKVLMLLSGTEVVAAEAQNCERLCYLFEDADGAQMQAARGQWKAVVSAGLIAEYWTDAEGGWAMKARSGEVRPAES